MQILIFKPKIMSTQKTTPEDSDATQPTSSDKNTTTPTDATADKGTKSGDGDKSSGAHAG